ncbi:putative leucine-rich repeat domain superfamily [Helianthus anomalus]
MPKTCVLLGVKFARTLLCGGLSEAFEKISLLEELSLVRSDISEENIEAAGCYCPLLKTLKGNQKRSGLAYISDADDELITCLNEIALVVAENLPELTHLELNGSCMTNTGSQAILDGCRHLESLTDDLVSDEGYDYFEV